VRRLSFLIGLVALLVGVAPVANALMPDYWGFAFVDKATPGSGYVPDLDHQATSCGAKVVVDQVATGLYTVHFPCDSGLGVPHVNAVNKEGVWCQIAKWAPLFTRPGVDVSVACYLPEPPILPGPVVRGVPTDTRFAVMLARSSGPLPPTTSRYGYLFWDGSSVAVSYNSVSGVNTVMPTVVGEWSVRLTGFGSAVQAGGIQVTAVNSAVGARCKVAGWKFNSDIQSIVVHCFNALSQPFNTGWTLSYQRERDIFNRATGQAFGYEVANALPVQTNFNTALGFGTNTVTPGPPDTFEFPKIGKLRDHVQVLHSQIKECELVSCC
jgi:hypothetical protein